jgi:hypothetical protein
MSESTSVGARLWLAYLGWLIEIAEDLVDAEAARAARDELAAAGESAIPWEQVKVELSLT